MNAELEKIETLRRVAALEISKALNLPGGLAGYFWIIPLSRSRPMVRLALFDYRLRSASFVEVQHPVMPLRVHCLNEFESLTACCWHSSFSFKCCLLLVSHINLASCASSFFFPLSSSSSSFKCWLLPMSHINLVSCAFGFFLPLSFAGFFPFSGGPFGSLLNGGFGGGLAAFEVFLGRRCGSSRRADSTLLGLVLDFEPHSGGFIANSDPALPTTCWNASLECVTPCIWNRRKTLIAVM